MSRVAETSEGVGSAALAGIRKLGGGMLGYPRNVYLLLFFTLGKGFQLSITQVTLSLYAYSIGFKQDFVGLLVAVPSLGSLIAAIPIGYLADRVSRKPLLIITGILNPLAIAVIALSTNATVMIAASVINGMLASAYWVSIIPMLTESVDAKRRVSVMSLNTFLMLGIGSLGGGIGGVVPEWVSSITGLAAASPIPLRFGVLTAALITFIPTIPLFWLIERRKSDASSATASSMETAGAAAAQQVGTVTHEADAIRPSARPIALLFLLLLIPDVLYTAGEGSVVALEPLFFRLRFHLQPGLIGALVAGAGLLTGTTALLAPRIVRRFGKLRVITTAQLLSAPMALLIGYAPVVWLSAAAELGRTLLRGAFEPVYATFAMERVDARYRARLSGFYSVTWSIGFSLGAAGSGWLQRNVSLSIGFLVGAILLILAPSWLLGWFARDPNVD